MRTLLSDWNFHKAGQGCFYSGIINANGQSRFSFVYDCGSTNGAAILRQEIADFVVKMDAVKKKHIDLLVISHYDADHVNQLPVLLKKLQCKIAVLPYLTNLERIKIYFSQGLDDGTIDEDYSSFISNPADYLFDLGVEQVIFIDSNDEEANFGNPISPNDSPDHLNERVLNSEKSREVPLDVSLAAFVDLKFSTASDSPEKLQLINSAPNTSIAKGNGFIRAGMHWNFFFHIKVQPVLNIEAFKEKLRLVFGITLTGDFVSPGELDIIMGTAQARSKLKKYHIAYFNDINRTGLVVLHGPKGQRHTECFRKRPLYSGRYCFSLLNGDCDLYDISYPAYIINALPETKIFQVPHHGSRFNWSFHNELDNLHSAHLVINHALSAKHPHPYVVSIINAKYPVWRLKHNTEVKAFNYHITSYI